MVTTANCSRIQSIYFTLASPADAKLRFMSLLQPTIVPATPRWQWLRWHGQASAESAVRRWLAPQLDCPAHAIPLLRDAYGRPRLGAPFDDGDVGWSHSGEGLLIAYARGWVLGVDLERERPRPRALELARRFFRQSEAAWLAAQSDTAAQASAFLRLWCAKEAVLKAHGRGLAFGLHRLEFAVGENGMQLMDCDPALGLPAQWRLREWAPQPGYRAALAWHPAAVSGPPPPP